MTTWAEESGRLFKPIPDMADDLSEDLSELSDVSCIHFEELVRFMTRRKGSTPKTVDCMAVSDKKVYLVEFKPLPGEGGEDIPGALPHDFPSCGPGFFGQRPRSVYKRVHEDAGKDNLPCSSLLAVVPQTVVPPSIGTITAPALPGT